MTLLTEAEARTKQCPVIKMPAQLHCNSQPQMGGWGVAQSFGVTTGGFQLPVQPRCLASECMAWRWETYRGKAVGTDDDKRGFCGAFGIPMESIV